MAVRIVCGVWIALLFGTVAFADQTTASQAKDGGSVDPRLNGTKLAFDTFIAPPYNRWGLQHVREVVPTRAVATRGNTAVLPLNPQPLGNLKVKLGNDRTVTVEQWLKDAYTDGFMVLHEGQVVYARYLNGQDADTQHLMFSVTKSFTGTMMLMLMDKGLVAADSKVGDLIAPLKASAFGDATVQQMLDMTNSIEFLEDYFNPDADITRFLESMGPEGEGLHANLVGLTKSHPKFEHGEAFHYVTPDPEVLGWIIRSVTGKTLAAVLHDMIWSKLGARREAYYWTDHWGIEMAGGGLSLTLEDAARFGQMILQDGFFNEQQIVPRKVAQRIKQPRNADVFSKYYDDPWYGEVADSYHDQWWGYKDTPAVSALGVHGQFIYIHSGANVVIAKQSSDPEAEGQRVDYETPIVMKAIADHLDKSL